MYDVSDPFTRVRLIWQDGEVGSRANAHLDFSPSGADPDFAQLQSIADAAMDSARTGTIKWDGISATGFPLKQCSAQNQEIKTVTVSPTYPYGRRISPTSIEVYSTGAEAPTEATPSATPGVAQLVSLQTALPGPRFEGRTYLCPPAEASVGPAGELTNAYSKRLADFVEQIAAAVLADFVGFDAHVVVSVAEPALTGVVLVVGRTMVATQRRRQRYARGGNT